MFWIPFASILIFAVTFIPSIILGYRRGWRSALFVSIVFLALNACVIGIGIGIYNHGLWDIYKSTFMKDETKISSIDYNVIASHYKVRVLLIFGGLLSPITYGITFLTYFLLRKPLNSYLMPKVKDISVNEKELVYRKNPMPSKLIGAGISAVTAIFASSFFASAANIVVTPREEQNGFNKFNDALGRIYSFGLAGNTEETKAISQFLRNVDGEFVTDVQALMKFSITQTDVKTPDNSYLTKVKNKIDDYSFLFDNEEAANAVFTALVAKVHSTDKFDVFSIDNDPNHWTATGRDANENQNSYAGQMPQVNGKDAIDGLMEWAKANHLDEVIKSQSSREALFNELTKGIETFENSVFYKEWKQYNDVKTTTAKELATRISSLASERSERDKQIGIIDSNIATIEKLTSLRNAFTNDSNDWTKTSHEEQQSTSKHNHYASFVGYNNAQYTLDTHFDDADHSQLANEVREYQRLKAESDQADSETQVASTKYDNFHSNEYNVAVTRKATLEQNVKTAQSNIDAANSQIRTNNTDIDSKTKEITRLRNDNSSLDTKIANLKNARDAQQIKINNANNRLSIARSAEQLATSKEAAAKARYDAETDVQQKEVLRKEWVNAQGVLEKAKIELTNATTALEHEKSELQKMQDPQVLESNKTQNTNRITTLTNEISNLTSQNQRLSTDVSATGALTRALSDANAQLSTYVSGTYKQTVDTDTANKNDYDAKKRISDAKDKATRAQLEKANKTIDVVNNAMSSIVGANGSLKNSNDKIFTLTKEIADKYSNQSNDIWTADDNSIYFTEQHLAFFTTKEAQTKTIRDDKNKDYTSLKNQLVAVFKEYAQV